MLIPEWLQIIVVIYVPGTLLSARAIYRAQQPDNTSRDRFFQAMAVVVLVTLYLSIPLNIAGS